MWARKETIAVTSWKCKVYGIAFIAGCALTAPFSAGMPAHRYWQWLGMPMLLATMYPFTALLYFSAMLISEFLVRPKISN
jgi:hypothetical protein